MDFLKKTIFKEDNDGYLFLIEIDENYFDEILNYFDKETAIGMISHKNKIGENFAFNWINHHLYFSNVIFNLIFKLVGEYLKFFNELLHSEIQNGKTQWMLLKNAFVFVNALLNWFKNNFPFQTL